MLSVLDLFRLGIGPSSSHTVGPMRIAKRFVDTLGRRGMLEGVSRVQVELQGSLALTGVGHGTPKAVVLGLLGCDPETVDPDATDSLVDNVNIALRLSLPGGRSISFDAGRDIIFAADVLPALHPNGMKLTAFTGNGKVMLQKVFYSTGGGFIASQKQLEQPAKRDLVEHAPGAPLDFASAEDLLSRCFAKQLAIHEVVLVNEDSLRPRQETIAQLDRISSAMLSCIDRGLTREGILPGGLNVKRRAPGLWRKLQTELSNEPERLFDWLNTYAMAVNEENAAGGSVVTAPTNGAAGIIPAVLKHYCATHAQRDEAIRVFILTAGGIGLLYKQRASISGAEMGCQGEVGVACSMAAAGLAAVWGGSPQQVAQAAEIGMEHNLGLTCDPVAGLVQIPCIERNAIGAVKAVNAARLALHSTEKMKVSLDAVIETMRQTGLDMSSKYKETSQGGLAVNVVAC